MRPKETQGSFFIYSTEYFDEIYSINLESILDRSLMAWNVLRYPNAVLLVVSCYSCYPSRVNDEIDPQKYNNPAKIDPASHFDLEHRAQRVTDYGQQFFIPLGSVTLVTNILS